MLKLIVLLLVAGAALFWLRLLWLRILARWRAAVGAQGQHRGRRASGAAGGETMNRRLALEVLGLSGNPSREEIIAAHRRLMQKLHPDRGGTTYLAQQLNDAKRVLLQDL